MVDDCNSAAPPAVLVCTVGGSHQPILTALKERRWDRVVFVCSSESAEARSSVGMVTEAVEITASEARRAQRLDPIPVQAGLDRDRWQVIEVPPDDPDRGFNLIADCLRRLHLDGAHLVADYTGGTKSMSAALFLAALDVGAELQLVTGKRADLVRVADLTERQIGVSTLRVATAREFERLSAGWSRFAYQEAAEGFHRLRNDLKTAGLGREELGRFNRAQELSAAFAAWDAFDHKTAANLLKKYRDSEIGGCTDWYALAGALTRGQNSSWGALHLRDLWHNAQRCAARGRYDDAVARLYRLWEATAQWLLKADCRIDTKVIKSGLKASWELYLHLCSDGAASEFWNRTTEVQGRSGTEIQLLELRLSARNNSIWAHGWNPIGRKGWVSLSQWTEAGLLNVMAREAERLGEPHDLPQLPTELPPL